MKILLSLLLLAALAISAGCQRGDPGFRSTDITGAEFGKDFSLVDHTGKRRSLADFRGKVVVVFFGFTHCPDVCPTTLAELANAMKKIGAESDKVQVLLVTVDPDRDSAAVLGPYVTAFDPRFLALRGSAEETAQVAREFKVIYQKVAGNKPENYTMDHSAGSYIFDGQGRIRLYVGYGQGSEVFAQDIGRLLKQG
ncbi:MAG TPA: SCO family protein [Burkholderiales bacterium]